jgi:NIMA (never in mitosis gene a)-related kinase
MFHEQEISSDKELLPKLQSTLQLKQLKDNPTNQHSSQAIPPLQANISTSKFGYYEKIEQIGSGSYGMTYKYRRKSDNKFCCIKVINLFKKNQDFKSLYLEAEQEPILWKQLKHPNIVQYYDHFPYKNNLVIVMEYIEGQTLRDLINILRAEKDKWFNEEFICKVFSQLVSALKYCHSLHIIHRDIKPENILITDGDIVKLIDFGSSKQVESTLKSLSTFTGTPIYMSPEILSGSSYSFPADIWSLGCVLYELMTLDHPFSYHNFVCINLIHSHKISKITTSHSHDLKDSVLQMLIFEPYLRIEINKLEKIPFLIKYQPIFSPQSLQSPFPVDLSTSKNKVKSSNSLKKLLI